MTLETVRLQVLLVGAFLSASPPPGDLVATVRSIDLGARSCSVVTGVGHALRIVSVVVEDETRLTRRGTAIGLTDLKPGMVVRIAFRDVAGQKRCASIEAQEKP
jgi:hypothetical protein